MAKIIKKCIAVSAETAEKLKKLSKKSGVKQFVLADRAIMQYSENFFADKSL